MPYAIKAPNGTEVRTDHFEAGVVIDIARECETSWAHVVEMPVIGDGTVMLSVYKKACELAGADVPASLTFPMIAAAFNEVEDDRPQEYGEGGIPVPTKGDAPDTTPADLPETT
jgi:hypothetical protein